MNDTLEDVVGDLARGRNLPTVLDDGTRVWVFHDPLLKQLRSAIASSMVGGAGPGGDRASMPINDGALELEQTIEAAVLEFMRIEYDTTGNPLWLPRLTSEENLLALHTHAWHDDGPEDLLRSWRAAILHMLDRKARGEFTIHTACPVCQQTHWTDENGDIGADPIVVTYLVENPLGTCVAGCRGTRDDGTLCNTIWEGLEAIEELGLELTETR